MSTTATPSASERKATVQFFGQLGRTLAIFIDYGIVLNAAHLAEHGLEYEQRIGLSPAAARMIRELANDYHQLRGTGKRHADAIVELMMDGDRMREFALLVGPAAAGVH